MQLRRFSEAAAMARRRELRELAINQRMATQGDADTFRKYLKELDDH